jgi:hypothetical protein
MNTAEINAAWNSNIDARLLTEADLFADSFDPQARRYNRILNSAWATVSFLVFILGWTMGAIDV